MDNWWLDKLSDQLELGAVELHEVRDVIDGQNKPSENNDEQ